jgi:sugar O-acyltransferase (sialic acid O-acetyltransferase NeuD family)
MRNVIIVGSGAVAAEITSYIEDNNIRSEGNQHLNIVGYLDSEENVDKYWAKYKLAKKVISDLNSYQVQDGDNFIIGISDIDFRKKMIEELNKKGGKILNFIHSSVIIADSATIGEGNIIYPYCIIGPNTTIGNYNLMTAYSFISHDCTVGDNNFFSTAGISGRVNIKNDNFFGIRSTVLPYVSIGNRNTIQAGMTVDKSVSDHVLVFHRFKEKVIAVNNAGSNE